MAYIYKITNDINEKVYIGQTSVSIEARWLQHTRDSKRPEKENRPLYRAMKKYGIDVFHISLIEETDNPNEREIYWIEQYNSYYKGYNATVGGEGRPKDFSAEEVEIMVNLFNQKTALKTIAAVLNCDYETVKHKLQSLGFQIDAHRTLKMAVAQIDKKTNEVINVYDSTHEAARALGDDKKNAHIRECCRGLRLSAYGYKWKFVDDIAGEWHGFTISGS